jgi:hypothetical protein
MGAIISTMLILEQVTEDEAQQVWDLVQSGLADVSWRVDAADFRYALARVRRSSSEESALEARNAHNDEIYEVGLRSEGNGNERSA